MVRGYVINKLAWEKNRTHCWAIIIILLLSFLFTGILGAYLYFSHDLPRITSLDQYRPVLPSRVYSYQGKLIGEFIKERRYPVSLSAISPLFIQAIIAAEDDRFFTHDGVDLLSIFRAAIKDLWAFEIKQGGSTITQQVVKSLLLTPERSFERKIKEAILARRIEKSLSKNEILTLYLN